MDELVLIDSSAWIDYLRVGNTATSTHVDQVLEFDAAAVCGLVKAELLQGARSASEYERLSLQLNALTQLDDPPSLWSDVAQLGFELRRSGHNGPRIPDLVIAVTALHHEVSLLTLDRHFKLIKELRPLRFA